MVILYSDRKTYQYIDILLNQAITIKNRTLFKWKSLIKDILNFKKGVLNGTI